MPEAAALSRCRRDGIHCVHPLCIPSPRCLFDQTGRAAIFWSRPSDSRAPKCTSKFKWRRAPPAPSPPFSFPRLSRFILRPINRTQLLTGSFLQNRGAFLLTSFSESGPGGGFLAHSLWRGAESTGYQHLACVPLGHLHPIGKGFFFFQKAKKNSLTTSSSDQHFSMSLGTGFFTRRCRAFPAS